MPIKQSELQKIEQIQRNYTAMIDGLREMDYWERLKILRMKSQQRRMERYRIIYTWKIIQNMVPNPGIEVKNSPIRGILCIILKMSYQASAATKTMKDTSFTVNGPRLFNCLPQAVRI